MSPLLTHLTNIEDVAPRFPSRIAFKIPQVNPQTDQIDHWTDITFHQFLLDIEHLARYWFHVLKKLAIFLRVPRDIELTSFIPRPSFRGYKYLDIVHVYAISRAGYIPQLINIFQNADYSVIQGSLEQANARAFIYESPLTSQSIYQTSGTTSLGKSKIVPCSYAWLDGNVRKVTGKARSDSGNGSIGYIAQFVGMFRGLIGTIYHTSCMVQYKSGQPSTSELVDIINRCKLRQLVLFPHFLREHLRASRTDPETLHALSSVDVIIYTGGGFVGDEEEEWAWKNGINLVNAYGSTECGGLLISEGLRKSRQNYLKRFPGPSFIKFIPISSDSDLLEIVIPPEAPECPDVSFRSSDGNYHTNDLFREVEPGSYVFCGRNDDWFNMQNCSLCDTKAIEDNARSLCGDIISDCVVVGNGHPSPVLVVEACSVSPALDESKLKAEIYRRIHPFHSTRYPHERIASPDMIFVVSLGTLPRTVTKATVRRKVIEEMMKEKLDKLFSGNV
ncbi:hypothetical protein BDP27DRAFT_1356646 [Rhodocollybia butyracea]|uniref:AMP-dependent synthetase/ligase domain-containing protein n=1 Tax=Rhodocollybia butyracea TaxID=206335 RepID=A0A9P5QA93_9AGAR|nr:hypothetical protein BDP27DRAFT_1356646 [Rhodocollybia butyracea]